jgi:hypothetical protein
VCAKCRQEKEIVKYRFHSYGSFPALLDALVRKAMVDDERKKQELAFQAVLEGG